MFKYDEIAPDMTEKLLNSLILYKSGYLFTISNSVSAGAYLALYTTLT